LSVSLIIALVTMIISLILANSITSPIRYLRKAMFAISAGNYQTVVDLRVSGEMGDLSRGFNDMARQLSQDHAALRKYISEIIHLKEYNDKIFNAIQEGIIVVNAVFTIEKVNQSFLRYFNLDPSGVENKISMIFRSSYSTILSTLASVRCYSVRCPGYPGTTNFQRPNLRDKNVPPVRRKRGGDRSLALYHDN